MRISAMFAQIENALGYVEFGNLTLVRRLDNIIAEIARLRGLRIPRTVAEEKPSDNVRQTTIVALIAEGFIREAHPPGIYRVYHDPGVDPVEAIKAAAQEFVVTPEGREYLSSDVGSDVFNWGDAVVSIPPEILAGHGVQGLVVEGLGRHVEVVNHDEAIAGAESGAGGREI